MCKNYSAHSVDSLEKRIADTEGKIWGGKTDLEKSAAYTYWDSQSRSKFVEHSLQKLDVIQIQFNIKLWAKVKSNRRTTWVNIKKHFNVRYMELYFQWPVYFEVPL